MGEILELGGVMTLYQIVRNVLGVQDVALTDNSHAGNTPGWDSLRHIELIFAIENAYRVRFTVPEIIALRSIGDMRRLLTARGVDVDRVRLVPQFVEEQRLSA